MVKAENETVIITMKNISAEPLNFDETQIVERFNEVTLLVMEKEVV